MGKLLYLEAGNSTLTYIDDVTWLDNKMTTSNLADISIWCFGESTKIDLTKLEQYFGSQLSGFS